MEHEILNSCKLEWIKAKTKKNHSYRYFVLGTSDEKGIPELRTVVLRNFDAEKMQFVLYTDARTAKLKSLTNNPKAELLFYNGPRLTQIRVKVNLVSAEADATLFKQQHEGAQKDYTTALPPGTFIKGIDQVEYTTENHFRKLVFQATAIEYLKLKRPNHIRMLFENTAEGWTSSFLTP